MKRNHNRVIKFRGETKTLTEWAKFLNISADTLRSRLDVCGWPIAKALSTPVNTDRRNLRAANFDDIFTEETYDDN